MRTISSLLLLWSVAVSAQEPTSADSLATDVVEPIDEATTAEGSESGPDAATSEDADADSGADVSTDGDLPAETDVEAEDVAPAPPAPRAPGTGPGKVGPHSNHWDLEQMYTNGDVDEGLRIAKERQAANPEDIDLYWHIARFIFEVGERHERDSAEIDKKALYKEMIAWSEEGLEIAPGDPHLTYAYGIAKARLGTTRGVLASLWMAKDIERAWTVVADSGYEYESINRGEHLPCDAHLVLGIFYRVVPDWWIVKLLSGTRGDLDKALEYLEYANTCSPDRINVKKELGVGQICFGMNREMPEFVEMGRKTLEETLLLTPDGDTDFIDFKHIPKILENPEMACEYSRDGQQDLDRESLEE